MNTLALARWVMPGPWVRSLFPIDLTRAAPVCRPFHDRWSRLGRRLRCRRCRGRRRQPRAPAGAACGSLSRYGRSPLPPGAVAGTLPPGCRSFYFIYSHECRWGATLSSVRSPLHWMVRRSDAACYARTRLTRTGLPRAQ